MDELAADSLPDDAAKVFLSYSRRDRENAQRIADVLRQRAFGVFRDTDDILPTEEWRGRLEELIAEADTVVFLLSPASAASEVCAWEVEYATQHNKRIAPIVIEDVPGDAIPPLLARLNFIFCTERDPFENAVATLVAALNTDIVWIREHTRLAGLAKRWDAAGGPGRLLLRGQDILDAELWRDDHPAEAPLVTSLQARFIAASRRGASRRQRYWIGGSLAIAASTAALAVFAYFQSVEADTQRQVAIESASEAARQRDVAEEQRDLAETRLREALVERARRNISDSAAALEAGRMAAAAGNLANAMATAADLGDPTLEAQSAAVARRLIFADRLHGYLEGRFDDPLAYPALQAAPDGATAFGVAQENLTLWSLETGFRKARIGRVLAAAYRDDGQIVGVRQSPGLALFSIDPANGQARVIGQADMVANVAVLFPSAGLAVVAGKRAGAPEIAGFDVNTGETVFVAPLLFPGVRHIALDVASGRIFVAGSGGGTISALDADGVHLGDIIVEDGVESLGAAPDGATIVVRTGAGHALLAPADLSLRPLAVNGAGAEEVAFVGEGRLVVQSGIDAAQLIDGETLAPVAVLKQPTTFGVIGRTHAGDVIVRDAQQFAVFDAAIGERRFGLGRTSPPIGGWSLSTDGRHLATVLQNGFVSVWSTETGRETLAVMPEGGAQRIWMLDRPGGTLLAAIDGVGRLALWRVGAAHLAFDTDVISVDSAGPGHIIVNGGFGQPLTVWPVARGLPAARYDQAIARATDPRSGRALLDRPGEGLAILSADGRSATPLEIAADTRAGVVAWGQGARLAFQVDAGIAVHDSMTGAPLAFLELPALKEHRVRQLAFLGADRSLAVLTNAGALSIFDLETTDLISRASLPPESYRLYPAADGAAMLVDGGATAFRVEAATGGVTPIASLDRPSSVFSAGPHVAIVQSGQVEDRQVWAMDIATGARRFALPWRGGAYAVGRDVIVEETTRGDIYVMDAKTGETRLEIMGDGGRGGFPAPPRLAADRSAVLAVNGGGAMARLIDLANGHVLAEVKRQDAFLGEAVLSPDSRTAVLKLGLATAVYDFSDVLVDAKALGAELSRRFPASHSPPEDTPPPGDCDRLASNVDDPAAAAEGVAYADLGPDAFLACAAEIEGGAPTPRGAYLLARAMTKTNPAQDAAAFDLLEASADGGHAMAHFAQAILVLEGRANGGLERAAELLRTASADGVGSATVALVRLMERGLIDGDPEAMLQVGADANQAAAMVELAKHAIGDPAGRRDADAVNLFDRAAAIYRARGQYRRAAELDDRRATMARRVGVWPQEDP